MFSKTKIRKYTKDSLPDGYQETIQKGLQFISNISGRASRGNGTNEEQISRLAEEIRTADAVVIGAGSGLSTSAGYQYTGERFRKYFGRFEDKYGFHDMYSGGFYPYDSMEKYWGFWAVYIWINRYTKTPSDIYERLYDLVKDKDYFVITTNVDHCFQKAGFDRDRLFYTQGDYGLLQDHEGDEPFTYDNEAIIRDMVLSLGYVIDENNDLIIPEGKEIRMEIPSELIPYDHAGRPMVPNLRGDDTFVQDEGWHRASAAYAEFLASHKDMHILYLELGVGRNTPVIIKYPFWQMTESNRNAVYACVNYGEAVCPVEIEDRSVCLNGDIAEILKEMKAE